MEGNDLAAPPGGGAHVQVRQNVQSGEPQTGLGLWPWARSTSHQNSLLRSVQSTLDVEARSSTCREPGAQVGRVAEGNGILVAEAPETSVSREALLVHRGFAMRADHGASELPNVNPLLVAAARAVKDPIRIRTMNWKLIVSSSRVAQHFGRSRE